MERTEKIEHRRRLQRALAEHQVRLDDRKGAALRSRVERAPELRQAKQGLLELAIDVHRLFRPRLRVEQDRLHHGPEIAALAEAVVVEDRRDPGHVSRRGIARYQPLQQSIGDEGRDVRVIEHIVNRHR